MVEEFRRFVLSAGLDYSGPFCADGKLHRFKACDDRERNSWYVLFPGRRLAGAFGCWKRGIKEKWSEKGNWSPEELTELREKIEVAMREQAELQARLNAHARSVCDRILRDSSVLDAHHYLECKGIKAAQTARSWKSVIVLPLRDVYATLQTLQFIDRDGNKRFKEYGRTTAAFFAIAGKDEGPLVICEGFATGMSINMATGYSVACAMNAGNLEPVAKALRGKYPGRKIIVAADDDFKTAGNPGLSKATAASRMIGASLAVPVFPSDSRTGKDFNDLYLLAGAEVVQRLIDGAANVSDEATLLSKLDYLSDIESQELLKDRFLCRGGGLLLVAPTGVGKSVLAMQLLIAFALGRECFGIRPARPLNSLLIQAENDPGDLVEMRGGIIHGLNLDSFEAETAMERIRLRHEDSRCGHSFLSEVERLLALHQPDLLCIDPALSYLGADANSQKDVGGFLRNVLTPMLRRHGCGCLLIHHTNKPSFGKGGALQSTDLAYLGSGSAEWGNWARAILALRRIRSGAVFELSAPKRGARLGWKDEKGNVSQTRYIAHSAEVGKIYWRCAEPEEKKRPPGRPKNHTPEDLSSLLPPEGLTATEWKEKAETEVGIKERQFYNLKRMLTEMSLVAKPKGSQKWRKL
jgi:phage/plasmid primase-like uncharacterized protein